MRLWISFPIKQIKDCVCRALGYDESTPAADSPQAGQNQRPARRVSVRRSFDAQDCQPDNRAGCTL